MQIGRFRFKRGNKFFTLTCDHNDRECPSKKMRKHNRGNGRNETTETTKLSETRYLTLGRGVKIFSFHRNKTQQVRHPVKKKGSVSAPWAHQGCQWSTKQRTWAATDSSLRHRLQPARFHWQRKILAPSGFTEMRETIQETTCLRHFHLAQGNQPSLQPPKSTADPGPNLRRLTKK